MKEQTQKEKLIKQGIINAIGPRYQEAHLSKIKFPENEQIKINEFLKKPKNFLVFIGSPGMGKTYFCASLFEWAVEMFGLGGFRYFNEKELFQKIRSSISQNSGDYLDTLKNLIDSKFLIIDDIGSQKKSEWTEEILLDLVDYRYNHSLPTVFTSNLTMREFYDAYHYRVGSRMFAAENKVIKIENGKDLRTLGY